MTPRKSAGARPRAAGKNGAKRGAIHAPQPAEHPENVVLQIRVLYDQVPNELADRFSVESFVDSERGTLIRAHAALLAIEGLLGELRETPGLLGK
jgi:hypothetical protein